MNDTQSWEQAVRTVRDSYERFQPEARAELDGQIQRIMQLKEDLVGRTLEAGSAGTCRQCGGECCRYGKYHVSVLDLLAYISSGTEPVTPDFDRGPACPYSGAGGCLMPPRFRPMTCVIFNCELVEGQMGPGELTALHATEGRLRDAIALAGRIAGQRLDRALLLSGDA